MATATQGDLTPLGNAPRFEGGVVEVAEGTCAWLQPNGELGESNAGLVVGEGESLLVDTLWDERLTRRMLDGFAPLIEGAPITTLFNTHGDGDHWYGNGLLDSAVEIVATKAAAAQMADEPPAMLARMSPLPKLAGALGSLPLLPGRGRLRGLAGFGADLARYEHGRADPRLPERTFSGTHDLEIGGRRVELIELGPAHTVGDAIAWIPDARIVFAADLVFNGVTPILWVGPVDNWTGALDRIAALDPVAIVPGHGPVADLTTLEHLAGYWRMLAGAVRSDGGDPSRLAAKLIDSPEYRDSPWGTWLSPERTLINVEMIAREQRDGETGPVGTARRISLLAATGDLKLKS